MTFVLLESADYYPGYGENKANRLLLEILAAEGHHCIAIAFFSTATSSASDQKYILLNGVRIYPLLPGRSVVRTATAVLDETDPDWILVSSEDFANQLLQAAVSWDPHRVVYLARTTQLLPFGPRSFQRSTRGCAYISQVRAILAVSSYVKEYIASNSDMEATVIPLPSFGTGPFPIWTSYGSGHVVMINPCAVKGISIFTELATRCPFQRFAAVPTWGTTRGDIQLLQSSWNIEIWPRSDNIDTIFSRTKVLLVPSLWEDAFPKVVLEAMARGIPVIASDVGGIREAKCGVDYVVPVNSINEYLEERDENWIPVPVVLPQDVRPWLAALDRLLENERHYLDIALASRTAALAYIEAATPARFLAFLYGLRPNNA